MVRVAATVLVLLATPVAAQSAPADTASSAAPDPTKLDWPWPEPDPRSWWDDKRPAPDEAADPLGGRRLGRHERLPQAANGYDPLLYRLWGLQPLQTQILRGGEAIFEVAARPSASARQTLIRVTVRRDGKAFVQARAGLGCCEAGVARRVGFDVEAPPGAAARMLALRDDPLWAAPREVDVDEGAGAADAICLEGTSYDLTLATPGAVRSVRRACDLAAIGQGAEVLEALFGLALGHEPRIDVLYPGGADFSAARAAYRELIDQGGRLKAATSARPRPEAFPRPESEPEEAVAPNSTP